MATLTLKDGRVFEGTIEELAELAKKLDESNSEGFRKVEGREPRVGDYVKFFKDNLDITAGKYYEIISFDDDGDPEFIDDVGDVYYAFLDYLGEKFELFEKVGGEETLKVGDYVVPLESADDEYGVTNTEMKLGKVVEGDVDCCDDIRIEVIAHEKDNEVGESYSVNSKHFRKATDEEVKVVLGSELKVGDYAKVIGGVNFEKGDIVRIVGEDPDPDFYVCSLVSAGEPAGGVNHSTIQYKFKSCLVKATDEEVAQAKAEYERKQAEQKWAKIGRKPGEFKVGDIVEYDGTLDEIKGVKEPGYICGEEGVTLVKGGWRFAFNIKLVAPVESRLDKEA
jgi:hypothetical protein